VHRFNAPLAAGEFREVGGAGAADAEAGDGVDDLLADERAAGVVAVAPDARDLPDVREVDPVGIGDPDGAADDPAVALVQFRVIGVAGAVPLDGVEDRALELRLVALDDYLESGSGCLRCSRRGCFVCFFLPGGRIT
jgi:hypothetical protein